MAPLHFIHIPKTGGTAIKDALRSWEDRGDSVILHPHKYTLRRVPLGHTAFFCLRKPEDRFVSAFFSRKRKGAPRYHFEWTAEERWAFGRFDSANQLGEALISDHAALREDAKRAMNGIRHIKDGYPRWLGSFKNFLASVPSVTYIGLQETLNTDFENLKKICGWPDDLALPTEDVRAHRNPYQKDDKYLSEEARKGINRWYRSDQILYDLAGLIRSQAGWDRPL